MSEPSRTAPASEPEVVGIDTEDADELLSALGSETARAVLATLHEDPATPSELADRMDMSLQRIHHHVTNLSDADLVDAVDEKRSDNGNAMTVYGPTDGPVVVFAGEQEESDDLRSVLSGLLTGFGILAVASLLVQEVLGEGVDALVDHLTGDGSGAEQGGGDLSAASTDAAGQAAATGPPPGLVFFLGGAAVLLAAAAVWYWRRRD
jgi:DNA-binding transcriptional ArsR family regulator